MRKPPTVTAYDAYCKSDQAPKGTDYVTTEGRPRCDITALQDARKAAWAQLSDEEKQHYLDVAKDLEASKRGDPVDAHGSVEQTDECPLRA